jgi:hypothetical protein
VCGCEVTPTVRYSIIPASTGRQLSDDEFDAFYLQGSRIRIQPADAKPRGYGVSSEPAESTDYKLALQHDDDFWVTTKVNITKFDNTDLISEIGTEVTDNRIKFIEAAAGLAKTAISDFVAAGPKGIEEKDLPLEIDLNSLLRGHDNPGAFTLATTSGVSIDIGSIPPDAIPFSKLPPEFSSHALIYSACRSDEVRATINEEKRTISIDETVKIADPNYVQSVHLPSSGKVKMHSECGVSVTTDREESAGLANLAVLQSFIDNAKSVNDELNRALEEKTQRHNRK